jgi:hypothetical protein
MREIEDNDEFMWKDAHLQNFKNKVSTVNLTKDFKPTTYTTETVFRPQLLSKRDTTQVATPGTAGMSQTMSSNLGKGLFSPRFQLSKPHLASGGFSNHLHSPNMRYMNSAKEAMQEGLREAEY